MKMFMVWIVILLCSHFHCGNVFAEKAPPGTIRVEDNLYVDQDEISQISYKEYLFWLKKIFGHESLMVKNAMSDVTAVSSVGKENIPISSFLTDPVYYDYPMVGVSFEQATHYCQWRSDRVYDMMLVRNKMMKWDSVQTKDNFFSINKFRSKFEEGAKELAIPYPVYRLPSSEEWDRIAKNVIVDRKFNPVFTSLIDPKKAIRNYFGSVSEMTSSRGVSKGGSYRDNNVGYNQSWDRPYAGPSDWLGFRCICSWEK